MRERLPNLCDQLASSWCDKHHDQRQLGEERVYNSRSHSITGRSQGRKLEAGVEAGDKEEYHFPQLAQSVFLHLQGHLSRGGTTHINH